MPCENFQIAFSFPALNHEILLLGKNIQIWWQFTDTWLQIVYKIDTASPFIIALLSFQQ